MRIVHIWARNSGKKIAVKIPPGCLLVQAGKQIEWMTGGLIKGESSFLTHMRKGIGADKNIAGFHEVVCTQATLDAMERRNEISAGKAQIRISSTFVCLHS